VPILAELELDVSHLERAGANRSALTALSLRNLSLRVVVTRFMGTIVSFL